MRIVDLMSEALVLSELRAASRDEVLHELVEHVQANASVEVSKELMYARLLDRERLASTAVGHGIAIPHAKLPRLETAVGCLARSSAGVDFGSRDSAPTHIFLAILAPEDNAGLHLKALARASRLLMNEGFRARLVELDDPAKMWEALQRHDAELSS